jgi:hypothetical protein
MAANQQPSYTAYTDIKREGKDDWWQSIGSAFMHADGDGYNVVLHALPIDGRVVLRLPKGEPEAHETGPKDGNAERDRQTVRDANDRRKARRS